MGKRQYAAEFPSFFVSCNIIYWSCIVLHRYNCVAFHLTAQFGPWSFGAQHGFARITRWNLERPPERLHNGDVEAIFSLMDNEFTRSMWNYQYVSKRMSSVLLLILIIIHIVLIFFRFRITYRLILREKELHFHIGVYNPSKELTMTFNLLLHTYLKVPDVRRCQITGLHGCTFMDKVRP